MIALERFTEKDFDRFISWIDNERFMYQFAGPAFNFPITHEQLNKYITVNNRIIYKVLDTKSNKVIGHAEINKIDLLNKNARLSRILIAKKNNRNKGFGKMLIKKLLEIGFEEINLHRIDLGVFDFNKSAIKCYESCGFKNEGLLRDTFIIDHEYHSVYNMSILKQEWENFKK